MKHLRFLVLVVLGIVVSLTACGGDSKETTNEKTLEESVLETTAPKPVHGTFINLDSYQEVLLNELLNDYNEASKINNVKLKGSLDNCYKDGVKKIQEALNIKDARKAYAETLSGLLKIVPQANGNLDYSNLAYEEKVKIAGALEAYALRNNLVGIPLLNFETDYLFNKRVKLAVNEYLPGYGFGELSEGKIDGELAGIKDSKYQNYFHKAYDSVSYNSLNVYNLNNSFNKELYSNISASYFKKLMRDDKLGFKVVGELAKSDEPVNKNNDHKPSTMWKFPVHVGDLKYSTLSVNDERAAFNNRLVDADDYLTPFKVLFNKANDFSYTVNSFGKNIFKIKGLEEFYNNTTEGFNEELWNKVGIKVSKDVNNVFWLSFEFVEEVSKDVFMETLNQNIFEPVPMDFINLVGVKNYLDFNEDKSLTPVDNSLSLGGFVLEEFKENEHSYKKNPNYVYSDTKYLVQGLKEVLYDSMFSSKYLIQDLKDNKLDSSIYPSDLNLEEVKDYNHYVVKDRPIVLNINSTSKENRKDILGDGNYVVEPILSNKHFIEGLKHSINQENICKALGMGVKENNVFADEFLIDGVSYNHTNIHKNLVKDNNYNPSLGTTYYKMALEELVIEEAYKLGDKANPTVIKLVIDVTGNYQKAYEEVSKQMMDSFNKDEVSHGLFKLEVSINKIKDINKYFKDRHQTLNYMFNDIHLNYGSNDLFAVIKNMSSDSVISEGFTLSYNHNTNRNDVDFLIYNGSNFSFDALVMALSGAKIENGKLVK